MNVDIWRDGTTAESFREGRFFRVIEDECNDIAIAVICIRRQWRFYIGGSSFYGFEKN